MTGHGFKAQGLRGQLQVIARGNVFGFVTAAVFVFHGVGGAVGQKLHHVRLANEAQRVVPQGQGTLYPHTFGRFHARLIGPRMHGVAAQRVDVVVKRLFQVNEAALARAVGPVLQGRQGNGVEWIGGHVLAWVHDVRECRRVAKLVPCFGSTRNMSTTFEYLEGEALKLAPAERRKLVELLTASLAPELGPGWTEEITRRVACMEAGQSTFAPAHETLAGMRQYLGQRRAAT